MRNHSTDFFSLKANLQDYLNSVEAEIAELEIKKTSLQNAIELSVICANHCAENNIGISTT